MGSKDRAPGDRTDDMDGRNAAQLEATERAGEWPGIDADVIMRDGQNTSGRVFVDHGVQDLSEDRARAYPGREGDVIMRVNQNIGHRDEDEAERREEATREQR